MKKILVIQTAFIGDVILATPLLEKLHSRFPNAQLDMLVRKGNEPLFDNHPYLNRVLIWDKKNGKYRNLFSLINKIRHEKYDLLINPQRFFSSGLLTAFSKAKRKIGFSKNPLSFLFDEKYPHHFGSESNPIHEVERNLGLLSKLTDNQLVKPKLYPSKTLDRSNFDEPFITISPGSVWFTKQFPIEKWIEFIDRVEEKFTVYLLGGKGEKELCEKIKRKSKHRNIIIKAGEFSFLESAALMKRAKMNYTNDSAPTHLASAVNAPVTTVFCSTVPRFGFTPLSDDSYVIEDESGLACRPCGLHGKNMCPKIHFKCSELNVELFLDRLK